MGTVVLTDEQLEKITEVASKVGAEKAIEKYREEQKAALQKLKDKRLFNTELLLKNYRKFRLLAVETEEKIALINDEMLKEAISLGEIIVPSIKHKKEKTLAIFNYLAAMMELYKRHVEQEDDEDKQRAYEVIHHLYLSEGKAKKISKVAELLNAEQTTIYRLRKKGLNEAALFVFGGALVELEMIV